MSDAPPSKLMEFHPLSTIFPLLEGADFSSLVEDIRKNGLCEPIWLYEGKILDGRNRYRACRAAAINPIYRDYDGREPLRFVLSLNLHRRHLNESQRSMVAARIATLPQGANQHAPIGAPSQDSAAQDLNVGRRSVQRARAILDRGAPELVAAVERGQIPVSAATSVVDLAPAVQAQIVTVAVAEGKKIQAVAHERQIKEQRATIAAGIVSVPDGVFDLVVIDPPWPYRKEGGDGGYDPAGNRASCPYPEMSLDEIREDIQKNVKFAEDCCLWLWTTHAFMRHAFPLIDAWGFQERAILTWAKDRMGLGRWLRSQSEFCIFATRGRPIIHLTNQTTVLHGPLREHSRKPDEFYALVDSLCVANRKLDYFSRESRAGWHQIGNTPSKFAGG